VKKINVYTLYGECTILAKTKEDVQDLKKELAGELEYVKEYKTVGGEIMLSNEIVGTIGG